MSDFKTHDKDLNLKEKQMITYLKIKNLAI